MVHHGIVVKDEPYFHAQGEIEENQHQRYIVLPRAPEVQKLVDSYNHPDIGECLI